MKFEKAHTACFSGYRPEKFSFPLNMDSPSFHDLQNKIESSIKRAVDKGYTTFLCGIAAGFDLICADMFLDVRESKPEYKHLQLAAIIPYQGHKVSADWISLYRIVVTCADYVEIVCSSYQANCFSQRNQWMVAHSSGLICFWDGQEGGTAQTVRMAKKAGITIHNIAKPE